jgi:hypothetical protein
VYALESGFFLGTGKKNQARNLQKGITSVSACS